MKKRHLSVLTLLLSLSWGIQAGAVEKREPIFPWMTKKSFEKGKKQANSRSRRKVASSVEVTGDGMSKGFRDFRDKFLTIKTKEEVHKFLHEMDENYDSYPEDLKFFAAQMIPFKAFKSFSYKLYPLLKKEKVTHSVLVTRVLDFAAFMRVNFPTDQWDAGFRFASEPFSSDQDVFETAQDLQDYVARVIYPALLKAAQRIEKLNFEESKIVWDNKLFYGTASFTDNFKRYRAVGEAERLGMLSSLHSGLAWAKRFTAYNVKGTMELAKDIGVLYGVDSFFSRVDGVTAKKLKNVLDKNEHKNLFTLKDGGRDDLAVAFQHLRESARLLVIAWNELKNRPSSDYDALNSMVIDPYRDRIDRGAENVERIVEGRVKLRSDVTGELITVDLPAFYANPPEDLKDLLPTKFEGGDEIIKKELPNAEGKMKRVKFRNYFYGRAVGWNKNAYKHLFPDLSKGSEVSKYARILNQSAGSFPVAIGVNVAMFYNR